MANERVVYKCVNCGHEKRFAYKDRISAVMHALNPQGNMHQCPDGRHGILYPFCMEESPEQIEEETFFAIVDDKGIIYAFGKDKGRLAYDTAERGEYARLVEVKISQRFVDTEVELLAKEYAKNMEETPENG